MLVRQKLELHITYEKAKCTFSNHSIGKRRNKSANPISKFLDTVALTHLPEPWLNKPKNLKKHPKLQLRNHASDEFTKASLWESQNQKEEIKANCLAKQCISSEKGREIFVERPSPTDALQLVELSLCPLIPVQTLPSRNAQQKLPSVRTNSSHPEMGDVLSISDNESITITRRRHRSVDSSELGTSKCRLQNAYDRQYQVPVYEHTAPDVTPNRVQPESELTEIYSIDNGAMKVWHRNRSRNLSELQNNGHGRYLRKQKYALGTTFRGPVIRPGLPLLPPELTHPLQKVSHKTWCQQIFQVKKFSDGRSDMGPNCVNILLEMRNNFQAQVPDLTEIGVPNDSPRLFTFSNCQKSRRYKMQNNLKLPTRARAAGMYTSRHGQHRFASTNAIHEVELNNNAYSMGSSMNTQRAGISPGGIRRRLEEWESTKNEAIRNSPSLNDSSRSWPHESTNAIFLGETDEDHMKFDPEDELDKFQEMHKAPMESSVDASMPRPFTKPGDLIDINVNGCSIIAVVILEAPSLILSYSERGTWHTVLAKDIRFTLQSIVSSNLVSNLAQYVLALIEDMEDTDKLETMPTVPRDAGSALIVKMAQFLRASDDVFRKNADRLSRAYEILPYNESGGPSTIRLEDAALQLLEKKDVSELTPSMLLIVHRTLERTQNILPAKVYHRMNPLFTLLPRKTLTRLELVHEWIRAYQENKIGPLSKPSSYEMKHQPKASINPLAGFAVKARRVISSNRQNRPLSPLGTTGSSLAQFKSSEQRLATSSEFEENQEYFDDHEQQIIGFLTDWSLSKYISKVSRLNSVGSTILRATEMYHGEALDRITGITMLQEMGIINPWEQAHSFESHLQLPNDDLNDPITCLLNDAHQSVSQLSVPLKDSMLEYRKSWRDSRIFCIDTQGSMEIDDGISLESVDGDEKLCWVHIHVANPSAFLAKDSTVARYARHICATAYLPEDRFPMLDAELSSRNFSLADGRPCITFSAKVSLEGELVEKSITHGILNGVRFLTPQDVAQALELDSFKVAGKAQPPVLRVGPDTPSSEIYQRSIETCGDAASLDATSLDHLRRLLELSKTLQRNRARNGALPQNEGFVQQKLSPRVSLPLSLSGSMRSGRGRAPTIHPQHSRHAISDPVISIHLSSATNNEVTLLISEFMVLAGQICAMWCSERNIPTLYRGNIRNPNLSPEPEVYRREVLDLSNPADPTYSRKWRKYMYLLGSSQVVSGPIEHTSLGLPAYCKATSPLRRYSDLFTHWQIEAAIRHEQMTGKSLVGCGPELYKDTTILPFSHREVEESALWVFVRERQNSLRDRYSQKHWARQALYRAFYFQEAALPATFEVSVTKITEGQHQRAVGVLRGWQLLAMLKQGTVSDREGGFRIDDVWEAKLTDIHPHKIAVIFQPLRLIERKDEVLGKVNFGRKLE